jgi:hypothetical protein
MDKTAVTRLLRVNWRTVGAIIERVVADELDPHRLDGLYEIGVDEVSCAPRGAGSPCGDERAPPLVVAATG